MSAVKFHRFAFVESTAEIRSGKHIVRVWRSENAIRNDYTQNDVVALVRANKSMEGGDLAELIASKISGIAAVDVKHRSTLKGIVIYTEWP